jgi:hypothetical protein
MNILDIGTADGYVTVREDVLHFVSRRWLKKIGMSRRDLFRCFAEGVEIMKEVKPGDRVRPVADQMRKGEWVVYPCGYSAFTDPLMQVEWGTRQ